MTAEAPKFLKKFEKYMPGPNSCYKGKPVGFWPGMVHGFFLPLTFIYQQYQPRVRLVETENIEIGYNLGVVLSIIILIRAIIGNI